MYKYLLEHNFKIYLKKMENVNIIKQNKHYKVLIRMLNKALTLDIPGDWRVSKIRKFLENHFQDQTKNCTINFIYCGKPIVTDEQISEIVKVKNNVKVRINLKMKFIN